MRLHRIEVQAFGPFADRQVVDVDQLSEAGLFLLHGPTGAGKTTLLDAVSFGLFGSVPGVRSSGESLRSQLADPSTRTEVMVELSVGTRRLRLTRTPAQLRPKRRGTGLKTENATALAEELVDGEWQAVSNRAQEVGVLVSDLLGMGADQFHQVVLLPQGEFARFLRASAEERRPLLERLFATQRFADVETWLTNRRKEAAAQLDAAQRAVDAAIAAVTAVAAPLGDSGADDDEGTAAVPTGPDDDLEGWSRQLLEQAAHAVRDTAATAATTQAARDAAAEASAAAEALAERQGRHRAAVQRAAQLEADADQHAERRLRLAEHRRALPVRPLLERLRQARAARRTADDELERCRRRAGQLEAQLVDLERTELADRRDGLLGRIGHLEGLLAVEARIDGRVRRLGGLRFDQQQRRERIDKLDAALAAIPEQIQQLVTRKNEATRAAGAVAGLRTAADDTARRLDAARQRDRLLAAVEAAEAARRAAVDHHQQAVDHHQRLQAERIANMAAELAAGLVGGDVCPVCGSAEHPHLAQPVGGALTTAEAIQAAADAAAAAAEARATYEGQVAELASQLAAVRAAAGDGPVGELEQAVRDATQRLAEHEELADTVERLEQAIQELAEAQDRDRSEREQLVAAVRADDATIAGLEDDHRSDVATLEAALDGAASVAAALEAQRRLADACDELISATDTAVTAQEGVESAEAEAQTEAVAAGFTTPAAAQEALLDLAVADDLDQQVADHETALGTARELAADPDLLAAAAQPPVELAAVHAARQEANDRHDQATRAATTATDVLAGLEQRVRHLRQAAADLAPVQQRHDEVARLARLVAGEGDNQLRMRLSVFVLAARLEQVAEAASRRLHRMSGGRYTLRHTAEEGDGRKRAGLGLLVADAWTGAERHPTTLSGGESFMASLSLALGMADVVTAEAGGTRIDTLFIDEGFGSLDDATLQVVMDVLDDLRSGGRTIGIVSHVADLRSRITTQLEVHKGPKGSSIRQAAVAS